MLACRVFLANDHPQPDWQAGEIAKVRHFRISRIPKLGFNRLKLRQDGGAVRVIGCNPIGCLKIGSFVCILLGLVTVDRFPLASGCESGFVRGCFVAVEFI